MAKKKLTKAQVILIKGMLAKKWFTNRSIAKRFDVNASSISRIKNNRAWRGIGEDSETNEGGENE